MTESKTHPTVLDFNDLVNCVAAYPNKGDLIRYFNREKIVSHIKKSEVVVFSSENGKQEVGAVWYDRKGHAKAVTVSGCAVYDSNLEEENNPTNTFDSLSNIFLSACNYKTKVEWVNALTRFGGKYKQEGNHLTILDKHTETSIATVSFDDAGNVLGVNKWACLTSIQMKKERKKSAIQTLAIEVLKEKIGGLSGEDYRAASLALEVLTSG